jgi:hypothetical protein
MAFLLLLREGFDLATAPVTPDELQAEEEVEGAHCAIRIRAFSLRAMSFSCLATQ